MNYQFEIFKTRIEILHESLQKASERCRFMLYTCTIGSALIFIVINNAYFSWHRKLNAGERLMLLEEVNAVSPYQLRKYNFELAKKLGYSNLDSFHENATTIVVETINKLNHHWKYENTKKIEDAISDYLDSLKKDGILIEPNWFLSSYFARQTFTIPLIGLSIAVSDMSQICGIFFLVLLVYNNFNLRREEQITYRLLKLFRFIKSSHSLEKLKINVERYDRTQVRLNMLDFIFQGVINSFVFVHPPNFSGDYRRTEKKKIFMNIRRRNMPKQKMVKNKVGRAIIGIVDYLPAISLFCLVAIDIYSLIVMAKYMPLSDRNEATVRIIIGCFLSFLCLKQCIIARRVNGTMEDHLKEMYEDVRISRNEMREVQNDFNGL